MKTTLSTLLALALIAGAFVPGVLAQGTTTQESPSTPSAPSATPKADVDIKADIKRETTGSSPTATPPAGRAPDVNVDVRNRDAGGSTDGGSALPRTTTSERTTFFGLSPAWAIGIGVAVLLIAILAIVSMSRGSGVHIDNDRRL
jgi:hypothetical protein